MISCIGNDNKYIITAYNNKIMINELTLMWYSIRTIIMQYNDNINDHVAIMPQSIPIESHIINIS